MLRWEGVSKNKEVSNEKEKIFLSYPWGPFIKWDQIFSKKFNFKKGGRL